MMVFLPLGFFGGYIPSWILKKVNLLRVPPEVELEGLDMAEFQAGLLSRVRAPGRGHLRRTASRSTRADPARGIREVIRGNGSPAPARELESEGEAHVQHRVMFAVVGTLVGWAVRGPAPSADSH